MNTIRAIIKFIDGTKTYMVDALTFVIGYLIAFHVGPFKHVTQDASGLALLAVGGISAFLRLVTWKPGILSGAVLLRQPDGGALVVKPPPIDRGPD